MNTITTWLVVGFVGQALFASRFIVQWLASERAQRSVVPTAFWYLSLGGSTVLLAYAIHRADPVFIVGQSTGLFIYLRNLHLIRRGKLSADTGDA
ncbi:lipid-A-disaccharide synthase N-terminal domain-containing protein [Lysobacter sp. H21R4]|uniref:lipid-A-disaccharide synthase N-terminal domain-containing protein n=1 Tax=Lysobacter sp. H21R4 TaxID=2781021 RepID=UPI0018895D0F|nr:lipid-A-disaccharide synthase N-terminal domain-containing protein [Lysobacter sp. H21R4]QOY62063.1 lipid-A-disaccharide synthase N-terminal domain-containing protein [Lysobacter sp. H21R4]